MAWISRAAAHLQEMENIVQASRKRTDPDLAHAGCRQLNRQRDTIQPPADLDDSGRVLLFSLNSARSSRPACKQGNRMIPGQFS